jgi:mannose-6-phosphate isomerase-like protein (cupin superfamily)
MNDISFAAFEADARGRGFEAVLERQWAPNTVLDTHTHDFAVEARVVQGEMWLTVGERTQHLRAGDRFEVAYKVPHAERYGPEGATYWVARRTGGA